MFKDEKLYMYLRIHTVQMQPCCVEYCVLCNEAEGTQHSSQLECSLEQHLLQIMKEMEKKQPVAQRTDICFFVFFPPWKHNELSHRHAVSLKSQPWKQKAVGAGSVWFVMSVWQQSKLIFFLLVFTVKFCLLIEFL